MSTVIVLVATAAPVDASSRHTWCHAGRSGAVIFRWIRSLITARLTSVPARGQRQEGTLQSCGSTLNGYAQVMAPMRQVLALAEQWGGSDSNPWPDGL